ncbi:MAG: DUF72 domain-containing protein, partial [Lysobacteraceae bacterium]
PRHPSWFEPRGDALWHRHAVARVAAAPARVADAAQPGGAGRWVYFRWHGAPRMYYDAYDDARLRALAAALRASGARRPAWCIFDNTAAGHALADAARLQDVLAAARAS